MVALYAHIPFCRVRCTYCAFNVIIGRDDLIPDFVRAMQREMHLAAGLTATTLYFGGGTPSLLPPDAIATLIATAREVFSLPRDAEITLESNPGEMTRDRYRGYREAGVNRLSIGVQSAQAADLDLFRRDHDIAQAEAALRMAREAGLDNINIDLIYGAPFQTHEAWENTLDTVIGWGPDHIALYSLIIEPGTWLGSRVKRGHIPDPDPDLAADMYEHARRTLADAGFNHYEISNWGKPCIHNMVYWRNEPFLGLGPGAHGHANGKRYWNIRSVPRYVERALTGERQPYPLTPVLESYEDIDRETAMWETLFLGLRLLNEGVSREGFAARFGEPIERRFGQAIDELIALDLLIERDDTLFLAERAYLISNQVFTRLAPSGEQL